MAKEASNLMAEDAGEMDSPGHGKIIALEDAILVDCCRKGDMDAFAKLIDKYQDRLYNMIYRMCGSAADAEEMAQETFLKALGQIGTFRGGSKFYTWLFRIGANLVISHIRRKGRVAFQSMTVVGGDGQESQMEDVTACCAERRDPGPETVVLARETRSQVSAALAELDEEYRSVIILRDMEDMDYDDISQVLDLPIGTVKSRLHRARCVLREKLSHLMATGRVARG